MGKKIGRSIVGLLLVALASACSDDDGDDAASSDVERTGEPVERGDSTSALVSASPQQSDGTSVTVDRVVLASGPGYVVIYADGGGAPGRRLGVSDLLDTGESDDLMVRLDQALDEGATVHAMVHAEDNGNESFDFPAADQPVTLEDGIVEVAFRVDVP